MNPSEHELPPVNDDSSNDSELFEPELQADDVPYSHQTRESSADDADVLHHWQVTQDQSGIRLDLALAQQLAQSRQQVKTLLEQGRVKLNGRLITLPKKGLILYAGSDVEVNLPNSLGQWQVIPEPDVPLTILAKGNGYVVVDKPAGMPVHPLAPEETGTVLNALVARYPEIQGIGEASLRSGVVHRLDIETSGTLVFATEHKRWKQLRQAFIDHKTHKRYTAVVKGHPPMEGEHSAHLFIVKHRPAKVKVFPEATGQSRLCDLSWRVIKRLPNASVLDITLGTGFLHQIRVMMASLKHGVAGDAFYGQAFAPRLMLHAHALDIGSLHAQSPIPEAMQLYIDRLA